TVPPPPAMRTPMRNPLSEPPASLVTLAPASSWTPTPDEPTPVIEPALLKLPEVLTPKGPVIDAPALLVITPPAPVWIATLLPAIEPSFVTLPALGRSTAQSPPIRPPTSLATRPPCASFTPVVPPIEPVLVTVPRPPVMTTPTNP